GVRLPPAHPADAGEPPVPLLGLPGRTGPLHPHHVRGAGEHVRGAGPAHRVDDRRRVHCLRRGRVPPVHARAEGMTWREQLEADGYAILPAALTPGAVAAALAEWEAATRAHASDNALLTGEGGPAYG